MASSISCTRLLQSLIMSANSRWWPFVSSMAPDAQTVADAYSAWDGEPFGYEIRWD
jgi:hypothetical protein